jgi:hypothetical protein
VRGCGGERGSVWVVERGAWGVEGESEAVAAHSDEDRMDEDVGAAG